MEELPKPHDISFHTYSTHGCCVFHGCCIFGGKEEEKEATGSVLYVCARAHEMQQKIWQSLCVPSQFVCCRKMIHAKKSINLESFYL